MSWWRGIERRNGVVVKNGYEAEALYVLIASRASKQISPKVEIGGRLRGALLFRCQNILRGETSKGNYIEIGRCSEKIAANEGSVALTRIDDVVLSKIEQSAIKRFAYLMEAKRERR